MRRIIFLFIVAVSAACVSSCSLKKVVLPGTGDSQDTPRDLADTEPTPDAYPVAISPGPVYVHVHMDPLTGPAKDFADFLATDKAAKILRQSGHIPVAAKSELVSCHQRELRVSRCPAPATVTPSPS